MTKLLASVCTPAETLMALNAGVDIIDLKDPAQGALGALSTDMIKELIRLIGGRLPVSATIGDILVDSAATVFAIEQTANLGVDIVKVGFFGDRYDRFLEDTRALTEKGTKVVAVLFADHKVEMGLLHQLKIAGFFGVMLDTANKNGKSLCDYFSMDELKDFLGVAHQTGLESGLAGSLRLADIPVLVPLNPGYLGFRGALCVEHGRRNALHQSSLVKAKNMLQESNSVSEYVAWA
ncbi:MAG TPA: (5-formylfuran-3-yl)methyl phosphate synthase [Methylophilaceae bacterium]|nr:(5-formylfuran-3-yl)methyl phosphate synthase [Methylophilaceae bacterium]